VKAPALAARVLRREAIMGTVFTFDLRNCPPDARPEAALDDAIVWLSWVDETFSTYRTASQVNAFDRGELTAAGCCAELKHVIALCHRFNTVTGGYFDAWATGRFDPSGVVKGWAVQEASFTLARHGFMDHVVDGGGDIVLSGGPERGGKWHVGVRHPAKAGAYCAALKVGPGAVATSGTYQRGQHVWDPVRQRPAEGLVSVTVVGPDLVEADAFATAALAMGPAAPEWLAGLDGYEAQVVAAEGRGWSTPGFKKLGSSRAS
jgi:thiamine biosynthesis lipoprotein